MDIQPSRLKAVQRRQIDRKKPPPVAKKPTEAAKQRKLAEQRAKSDRLKRGLPSDISSAPLPPIGYNDADRFYISDPVKVDRLSVGSHDSLNDHILNEAEDKNPNLPGKAKSSRWLDKQLDNRKRFNDSTDYMAARNAQTDTQELERDNAKQKRIMQDKISDLETENKIKDRELDTNRWIEKEMDRKLKTTEDLFAVKQHLKDKDRLIDQIEKTNSEMVEEISKLEEEVTEKERFIFELQAEVDNLDRVIVAKNALRESDKIREISDELDHAKDELSAAEHDCEHLKKEVNNLHYQLERREREISIKNEKIEELNKELVGSSKEIGVLENDKLAMDNHLKTSERENRALRDQETRHVELKQKFQSIKEENDYLKDTIRALESKIRHLEGVQKEKEALQDAVVELKSAVHDKNKLYKEKTQLEEENQMLQEALRDKSADEAGALRELDQVKTYAAELDKENEFYRDLEKDFHSIKFKYEELERIKHKNDKVISQLRPKINRLQARCKEKDDLIRRLANELRSSGDYLPKGLLLEADRNQAKAMDDYINPADLMLAEERISSPAPQLQTSPVRQPRSRHLIKELRPDLLDEKYPPAWNEPLYVRPPADVRASSPRHSRPVGGSPQTRRRGIDPERSYNPSSVNRRSYSPPQRHRTSNIRRPGLNESINVKPDVGSKRPGETAMQPAPIEKDEIREDIQKTPPVKESFQEPDFSSQMPKESGTFHLPHKKPLNQQHGNLDPFFPDMSQANSNQIAPPSNAHITRTLSDGSVMIEWSAPPMDGLDRSNGIVVAGYKIFINNIEDQQISSSRLTRALLSSDLLTQNAKITIQTFGYDGELSEKVEVLPVTAKSARPSDQKSFEENPVRLLQHTPANDYYNQDSKNKDDTVHPIDNRRQSYSISKLNDSMVSPRRSVPTSRDVSPRRKGKEGGDMLVAKCDYDPSNQSPSAFPSYELSFKQGDSIEVFGPVRPDGLYNAQINGRRGVVPAQYLDVN